MKITHCGNAISYTLRVTGGFYKTRSLASVFLPIRVPKILSRAQEWEPEHLKKGSELCKPHTPSRVKWSRHQGTALRLRRLMTPAPIPNTANAPLLHSCKKSVMLPLPQGLSTI